MNYATPAVLAVTTPICTINAVQTRPRSRREPQTEPRIEETHSHIFSRCLRCFWQQARLATKCIYPLDLGLMPRSWARLDRIQRGDGRDDGGKRRGCVPSSVTLHFTSPLYYISFSLFRYFFCKFPCHKPSHLLK